MKTKNNNIIYIESMGKVFEVRLMTTDAELVNEFMENNPDTSLIDETDSGILIVANNDYTMG